MKRTLFLLIFLFVSACETGTRSGLPLIESDEIYLSIDAGSMLGMIPLMLLEDIEKQTGQPIHKLVNGIIGTSTGAIVGSLLTLPIKDGKPESATQGLGFYKEAKNHAFSDQNTGNFPEMKRLMEKELKETFKEVRLSQALISLRIAAYEATKGQEGVFVFDSEQAKKDSKLDIDAASAIRASTAIVPIFGQATFDFNGMERTFIDLANGKSSLPSKFFMVEPSDLLLNLLVKDSRLASAPKGKRITIYSLGTGYSPSRGVYSDVNDVNSESLTIKGDTISIIRLEPDLRALYNKILGKFGGKIGDKAKMDKLDRSIYDTMSLASNSIEKEMDINSMDAIENAGEALKTSPDYLRMLEDMKAKAKKIAK